MTESKNKKIMVYETLKKRIIGIEIKPGQFINETEIAGELGLSKTPVREAISRLEHDRFIQNIPGRGSMISQITQNEISDVLQVREMLESSAAFRVAAFRGNEELKAILSDIVDLLDSGMGKDEVVFEWGSHENIHFAIVHAVGNEALNDIYSSLMDRIIRIRNYFGHSFTRNRYHDVLQEHIGFLDAIMNGEQRKAAMLMTEHLSNAGNFLLSL